MRRRRRLVVLMLVAVVVGIALIVLRLSRSAPWYRVTVFADVAGEAIDPRAFNDRGQVVGTMTVSGPCHLFLWDPQRGKIALDRYVNGLGNFEVRDLNNHGGILGVVHAKDGSSAAVLLEPILEQWGR